MSCRKRSGISVCNSTATSPRRPCVFMTTARVIHSPPASAISTFRLLDDLECVALLELRACRRQHVAQSTSHPAGAPNDLAQISLRHFELNDGFVSIDELVDKNLALGLDDRLGNVFDHGARVDGGVNHSLAS